MLGTYSQGGFGFLVCSQTLSTTEVDLGSKDQGKGLTEGVCQLLGKDKCLLKPLMGLIGIPEAAQELAKIDMDGYGCIAGIVVKQPPATRRKIGALVRHRAVPSVSRHRAGPGAL